LAFCPWMTCRIAQTTRWVIVNPSSSNILHSISGSILNDCTTPRSILETGCLQTWFSSEKLIQR
jgi:hypothetical protein